LGGNEQSSHKYVSELLGKETIDTNTYGRSHGRSGSYTKNFQLSGRELMTPDEVRMLDNRYALLFIRGEMPVMDEKYDLLNHPNVKYTPEKGGAPYVHGGTELAVANLSLATGSTTETRFVNLSEIEFELLSDEEIEAELLSGGNTNEEHL
jgi:type IV secretion system protein VirD4